MAAGTFTLMVVKFCPFGVRSLLASRTDAVGPAGETDVERVTVPAKLFKLVSVRSEESEPPFEIVRDAGVVAME